MTDADINGIAGAALTSGHFDSAGTVSCRLDVNFARLAYDGTRPRLIRAMGLWLGGFGASRVFTMFAGAVGTDAFSLPSRQGAFIGANLQGAGYLIRDTGGGTTIPIGYTANGGSYFGRNGQAGNTISGPAGTSFGNAVLAGVVAYQDVPTEPQAVASQQIGVTSAKITWAAPADDGGGFEGVQGYLVQGSTDGTFVPGVSADYIAILVPVQYAFTFTTLRAGGNYKFRVSANNTVTSAAGTFGPPSAVSTLQMIAETGNIDGWAGYGTLPSGAQPITAAGVRRATVKALPGSPSVLLRETVVVSPPVTIAADTYGLQRTIDGLVVGKVYRVEAQIAYVGTAIDANTPVTYQIGRSGGPYGDPVTITQLNLPYDMPSVEFTASSTSQTIRLRLHAGVTRPGSGELENVALWNIRVSEIASASPYRLRSIAYESSLLNHFDLANNSVGARWWVDNSGVTQFSANLGSEGPLAVFTDDRSDGKLEYVGISTSFDTRNVVNDLAVTNHGAVADGAGGWNTADDSATYTDLTSIATNGTRKGDMDMSLYNAAAYAGSLDSRAAAVLAGYADPEFTVTGIRWNAQEDPELAARLDIYSPVDVEFRGNTYQLRVVNIEHVLTPRRWIMVLQLDRRG